MTRRNALERIRKDPQQPVETIPFARERKREKRLWDQRHPVITYFIPSHLKERAKDVQTAILGLSQKHMTTTSSVAGELIKFALSHVRSGKLKMNFLPTHQSRRKMGVTLVEEQGWPKPQEIPQPIQRQKKGKVKDTFLGYRWGREVDVQIKALGGKAVSPGEVVVFLLEYAIAAYKKGEVQLREETVVVSQKVSAAW
ncbi:MAG TPA: hypothetical protein VNK49_08925 [Anaerolineales bacterium]|nr:hypothetical protein [Anaerolineales bacterium]